MLGFRGGIETLVSNWAIGHLFDILANNLVALLYPCPENLYEAKFKSNKLIIGRGNLRIVDV